ncbi:complement C1q-like protein 2 [Mytilus californianus]|uniref:complement C1q-like protein 2 n=1 Tax=Mytilus californianus TaxID=6549 RepID=UPI0022472C56|nr:complement C1q-like protein 2 [Mytilus californianus]
MHYSILFLVCAFCRSDNVGDLTKRVDVHETEMTRLKSENEMLKDIIKNIMTKITYLEDKINEIIHNKRVSTTNPVYVAFHANVAGKVSVHDNEDLHFQTVNANLGSAYNGSTGVFKSPSRGYYVFFVHFLTYAPKTIEAVIVKNGASIQNVYAGTREWAGYGTGSNLAIVELMQGDRVWVKVHNKYHDMFDVLDGLLGTFAGFLLYPTS